MHRLTLRYRAAWLGVVAAAIMGLVTLVPHLGHTTTSAPLWSERSATAAPTATVPQPNWVELTRALKPAVVNISTRRVEERVQLQSPFGDNQELQQFFRRFGEPHQPRRRCGASARASSSTGTATSSRTTTWSTAPARSASGCPTAASFRPRCWAAIPRPISSCSRSRRPGCRRSRSGTPPTLEVGEPVMAIGNPFGLEQTVTTGIVSGTGRVIGGGPYDDFIQTDASINPGNSGGPLINARGQAIGINAAIFSQTGGSIGIGFAIPVNLAKPVLTQLADTGHVVRGWLGVGIQPVTAELAKGLKLPTTGALVSSVADGSPAAKAGLKAGDVISSSTATGCASRPSAERGGPHAGRARGAGLDRARRQDGRARRHGRADG